jgi:hypothetical protein
MKNIHIILFFTLWVILGSCSTYYVSNKQVMEVLVAMDIQMLTQQDKLFKPYV